MKINPRSGSENLKKFSNRELAEALVFPSEPPTTSEEIQAEENFWKERRKQFENRTPQQKIHSNLLQLRFQLEDYLRGGKYAENLNFSHFLNEYINRLEKRDKQFAEEVDIKPAVLSQYLNNHRNPTEEFIIRLEIHSNGIISAINWFKLLQKSKEHEIMTNKTIRKEQSLHVKNRVEVAY